MVDYLQSEERAVDFLKSQGFNIMHRNLRLGKNEIDIVCEKNNIIYAVEVKYRSNTNFFNISEGQLNRISYTMNHFFPGLPWEIFAVLVNKYSIEIIYL